MRTKEEFYKVIQGVRAVLSDPENLKCTCPKTNCEWHGNCKLCVAQHRYYKDHIPNCFQNIHNEKLKQFAALFEMKAVDKEKTPPEYWDYVREQDALQNK